MKILVIEDDREAATYLVKAFREAGHQPDHAGDGLEGYGLASEGLYDVLIVDRMLPKLDGLSLIGGLREQKIETPVLILSALGQVDDRVKGLRAGGDDYLAKPYAFSELLARVEVLARRRGQASTEPTIYRVGDLEFDRLAHKLTRAGKDIFLQPREFLLRRFGGRVELSVSDRGPGIAAQDRARVLERFVRLEGSRSRPGSGLGLSLASAVARLHHGVLRLEDNEPGLRVILDLPVGESPRR